MPSGLLLRDGVLHFNPISRISPEFQRFIASQLARSGVFNLASTDRIKVPHLGAGRDTPMLTTDQSANPSDEINRDLGAAEYTEICQLWHELLTGQTRILRAGTTADCHYFEIVPSPRSHAASTLGASRSGWLVRALLGDAQKVIQAEAKTSASTIATQLGDTLAALGLQRRSHRIPLLLVLMAHVVHGKLATQHLEVMRRSTPSGEGWLVWSGRPELMLAGLLSPGEMDVLLQLVAGQTYLEIGGNRRTSPRTVANQIATIYSKLKLSGRAQLLCHLAVMPWTALGQRSRHSSPSPSYELAMAKAV